RRRSCGATTPSRSGARRGWTGFASWAAPGRVPEMRWPDVEKLVIAHLNAALSVRVATNLPANVESLPGFVRVSRGPGSDDGITDEPLVDVEAFAPSRGAAADLAEGARQAMH